MSQLSIREVQIQKIRDTILSFIKDKKYTLITNINEIKTNTDSFSYICFCGQEKTRTLFNIKNCKGELNNPKYIPDCCIENGFALSIDPSKWYLDKSIKEYKDSNEVKWKRFQQYWISEKGIIIGSKGIPLETPNNEFKFSRKVYKLEVILAELFLSKEYSEKCKKFFPYFEDNIIDASKIRFKAFEDKESNIKVVKKTETKSANPKSRVANIEYYLAQEYKEHTEFENYMFFRDGTVIKKPFSKNKDYTFANITEENGFSVIRLVNRHRIDKIILLCFVPYHENLSYSDYNNITIRHIDGNMFNNALDNLEYYSKDNFIQERIDHSKRERIRLLHNRVREYISSRKATLITDINTIKTVRCEFEYKCACNNTFTKTIKAVSENGDTCNKCNVKALKSEIDNIELDFEKDGQIFKKFSYGWVSDKGKILNNLKKELSQNKGYIKIANTLYNIKKIISETFKIKYHELLGVGAFYLKTIDGTENYSVDNIYIWTNSKPDQQLIPDNIEINDFVEKNKTIGDTKYFFLQESQVPQNYKEFEGYRFYENGLIKVKNKNIYTYGRKTKNGYMEISIKKIYRVHRILCYLFHPIEGKTNLQDYPKILEVNHKDGNKCNNHYTNLEWTTKNENSRHAIESGLCGYTSPVNLFKIKENGEKEFIKYFPCISWAHKETKFSVSYIKKLADNLTNPYNEYTFEYAEKNQINVSESSSNEDLELVQFDSSDEEKE